MYTGKHILALARVDGTKWCKKNKTGNNVDVALVRKNGDIIWYLQEKGQPKALVDKIYKNSQAEKKKISLWKKELEKIENLLKVVKQDSYEYFNLLHDFFWYKDALSDAS